MKPQDSHASSEATPDGLEAERALRFWGLCELSYGALVLWLSLSFIPKHPWLPSLIASFGGLSALAGLGLALRRRGAWRLSLALGGFAVTLGVALCSLTVMAGFYWLSVFGVLGYGVAISSGLLISGLLQLLAGAPSVPVPSH